MLQQPHVTGIPDPFPGLEEGVRSLSSSIMSSVFMEELRREERIFKNIPVFFRLSGRNTWDLSATVNISRSGVCIYTVSPLASGMDIEVELGRKLLEIREVFAMNGTVVGVSRAKDGRNCAHIALRDKRVIFHRVNNVLWSLADFNSWFLTQYARDCNGLDVEDTEGLQEAYRLVYQEYRSRNLCRPDEGGMFYNAYSFVPGSRTFVLKKENKLLGTICMVADSPMGLPMETIFPQEIRDLRSEGRKIVEIGALSLNSKFIDMKQYSFKNIKKQAYLYKLYKIMFDYVRATGGTDLVIGCHPRHVFLYQYLTFEVLSAPKDYHGANAAPAVLMRMEIDSKRRMTRLLKEGPGLYFFRDVKYPRPFNTRFTLPAEFVRGLLKHGPYWNDFFPKQKDYLRSLYGLQDLA